MEVHGPKTGQCLIFSFGQHGLAIQRIDQLRFAFPVHTLKAAGIHLGSSVKPHFIHTKSFWRPELTKCWFC